MGHDPALLAPEAVVARHRTHGAAAHDHAGAQLTEDGPFRVEPRDVEGHTVLGGVEDESPLAEGLDDLEVEGAQVHLHAVVGALLVGPYGGVAAADVHDAEGLGRAEVRVEREPDDHQELTHFVLAGEPHAARRPARRVST